MALLSPEIAAVAGILDARQPTEFIGVASRHNIYLKMRMHFNMSKNAYSVPCVIGTLLSKIWFVNISRDVAKLYMHRRGYFFSMFVLDR